MSGNPVIYVFGEPIEIVATSRSTNYTCCVGIQTCPPGGGPPPHKHEREEETFVVLDGRFELFEDGAWTPLATGAIKCSLRGQYHAFRNVGSTPGRMMFVTNAGASMSISRSSHPWRCRETSTASSKSASTTATCSCHRRQTPAAAAKRRKRTGPFCLAR